MDFGGREKRFELGHFESLGGDWQWRNTLEDRDTSFRSEYVIVVYRTEFEREKVLRRGSHSKRARI